MTTLRQSQSPVIAGYLQQADAQLHQGRPNAALAELDLAYLLDPGDPGVRYQRGQALAMLGRFDAAVAELDAAISLDAANADAWLQRGLAHLALENWADAAADCSRALQLDAAPAEAWRRGGRPAIGWAALTPPLPILLRRCAGVLMMPPVCTGGVWPGAMPGALGTPSPISPPLLRWRSAILSLMWRGAKRMRRRASWRRRARIGQWRRNCCINRIDDVVNT